MAGQSAIHGNCKQYGTGREGGGNVELPALPSHEYSLLSFSSFLIIGILRDFIGRLPCMHRLSPKKVRVACIGIGVALVVAWVG